MDIKFKLMLFKDRYLNKDRFKKVISHPFLILVVGAIISGLLVPYFTHQWQDNQKQLELKTDLADEINKAISDSMATARGETGGSDSFRNWLIDKEMIGSKIEAYFSDDGLTHNWNNLSSAVEEFSYHMLNIPFPQQDYSQPAGHYYYDVCNRLAHVLKLYTSYPQNNPININRNILTKYHCNRIFLFILNPQNLTAWTKDQKYFLVRDNKAVNWNALFYWNQTNQNDQNEISRSTSILFHDIEDHKNNLIKLIFKLPITAFK